MKKAGRAMHVRLFVFGYQKWNPLGIHLRDL